MAVRVLIGPEGWPGREAGPHDLAELYAVPTAPTAPDGADGAVGPADTTDGAWLRVNMVATVDGAAQGDDGRSGGINNAVDKQVFHALREMADCIIVGAGTARAEGYRPAGKPVVVVSRSGELPELLRGAPPGQLLLATTWDSPGLADARELLGVEHVLTLGRDTVDLVELREELVVRGMTSLLSEGGPRLLRDLLAAGVADELCLTWVPRLLAGDHLRITHGPPVDVDVEPVLLMEQAGTLLGRWAVRRPA